MLTLQSLSRAGGSVNPAKCPFLSGLGVRAVHGDASPLLGRSVPRKSVRRSAPRRDLGSGSRRSARRGEEVPLGGVGGVYGKGRVDVGASHGECMGIEKEKLEVGMVKRMVMTKREDALKQICERQGGRSGAHTSVNQMVDTRKRISTPAHSTWIRIRRSTSQLGLSHGNGLHPSSFPSPISHLQSRLQSSSAGTSTTTSKDVPTPSTDISRPSASPAPSSSPSSASISSTSSAISSVRTRISTLLSRIPNPFSRRSSSSEKAKSSLSEGQGTTASKAGNDLSWNEIKRLFELAKPERKMLLLAVGLLVISSIVTLSVPFTLGRIIDLFTDTSESVRSKIPVSLPVAAGLLAAFFFMGAAANMGRSILMRISGQRIVSRLREDAYSNVLKQDMAFHDLQGLPKSVQARAVFGSPTAATTTGPHTQQGQNGAGEPSSLTTSREPEEAKVGAGVEGKAKEDGEKKSVAVSGTGDILSRLGSDAGIVGESLTRELSEGLRALVTATAGVTMMLVISTKLTFVMLAIVPPVAIGAVFYGRFLKKLSTQTQKAVGEMTHVAEERLGAIRTVHAFNAVEPMETKRFSEKVQKIFELAKKEAYASGFFFGGAGFSGNLTMLALLSYGGSLVARGEITVGDLSSLMLYTAYVGSSLVGLTSFFSTIMKGLGASSRIFELLDARPYSVKLGEGKRLDPYTPPQPLFFKNLKFEYPSRPGSEILKGVTFEVEPGTSVAIAGGSGSGKSTIANLLLRFYDPKSGSIKYGQEDIKTFTPESWRDRVAIVPQDPALFSQTITENIAYGNPRATLSEIREAARLANCDFINDLPQGFDTQVGPRAAQLSGGQRQRLAIARALVKKPQILVLDEATSALDASSESAINQAIQRITASNRLTTILIAHRLSTLRTSDRIILMEDGKVAESGTYPELSSEGTKFSQLVQSQLFAQQAGVHPKGDEESK